jgi:Flp pilus assembly protein TadB
VSRARQAARVEREQAAADRRAAAEADRRKVAAVRARRERRSLAWRRVRLWQHGPAFRRQRERLGVLATFVLLVLLLVYLFSRSIGDVLVTALALVVCAPVLALLFLDRRRR